MNRQLAYAVVADGGTDRLLVPIIQWAVHRLDPGVEILEPEFRKRRGSVAEFLTAYRPGAMLIFVIENMPDPKNRLDDLLFQAAGAPTGRRGRNFRRSIAQRRVSVAEYIEDYSPLESLAAFRRFQGVLADRYPYRNV